MFRDPVATRIHDNNEASSHTSQIPTTRAFLRKLDGLPFELEPIFVRSMLFCRHSYFGRAFEIRSPTNTRSVSAMSNAAVIADQPARQSSRTRYAVGLRCVRVDRPPALNADYSGSNGSGRSAATVSAYHQVWASMETIGSKGWFSMTAVGHNTDIQWIFLDIAWTLVRVSDSHSSGYYCHYLLPCEIILYTSIVKLILFFIWRKKIYFAF